MDQMRIQGKDTRGSHIRESDMDEGDLNERDLYDVVVVGGGPAGLSAAIYMARAKYRVLVVEKEEVGGQIRITDSVVNYPGIERIDGKALTGAMARQARRFGAEFASQEVVDLECNTRIKRVITRGRVYDTLGVILALGASPRKLNFAGEEKFQGRGVAYCATCDGEFFTDRTVYVVGGGYAAVEEGLFLTRYARRVIMIVREEDFTCARTLGDQAKAHPKIEIHFHTEITKVTGETFVTGASFRDNLTGKGWESPREKAGIGIFVFAGYVPASDWLPSEIDRNLQGYLVTDQNRATSVPGVYGAGDVCVKGLRQVVTAVADGAVAATSLELYVEQLHHRLHLPDLVRLVSREKEDGQDLPDTDALFDRELKSRVSELLKRMEQPVIIKIWSERTDSERELFTFFDELAGLSDQLVLEYAATKEVDAELWPAIRLLDSKGNDSGFCFHGIPTGEEFTSFLLAICQLAGPAKELPKEARRLLQDRGEDVSVQIFVSLTCTMCPQTVRSAVMLAMEKESKRKVRVDVFDLSRFPQLKEKYQIRSVPCIVVDEKRVLFGRKEPEELAREIFLTEKSA
ncbi:MAG: FAD-dependent oxidoreductase [Lachnospiraceae bacterium]|nr:FAD-dependent oxidoreductase [Lachnospiraceae bacterium]